MIKKILFTLTLLSMTPQSVQPQLPRKEWLGVLGAGAIALGIEAVLKTRINAVKKRTCV